MPVQINEIAIRAVIAEPGDEGGQAATAAEIDTETLVADCVEQVLEILAARNER